MFSYLFNAIVFLMIGILLLCQFDALNNALVVQYMGLAACAVINFIMALANMITFLIGILNEGPSMGGDYEYD